MSIEEDVEYTQLSRTQSFLSVSTDELPSTGNQPSTIDLVSDESDDGIGAGNSGSGIGSDDGGDRPVKRKRRDLRYCAWSFTLQLRDCETTEIMHTKLQSIRDALLDNLRYMCYQLEIAPSTGQRHVQGYIHLKSKRSMSSVRGYFAKGNCNFPHLDASRGTPMQNRNYCSKEESAVPETFREYGQVICHRCGTFNDVLQHLHEAVAYREQMRVEAFNEMTRYRNLYYDLVARTDPEIVFV